MLTTTLMTTGMAMPGTLTSTDTNTTMLTRTSTNTGEHTKLIPTIVSTGNTIMITLVMKSFRVNTFTSIRDRCATDLRSSVKS